MHPKDYVSPFPKHFVIISSVMKPVNPVHSGLSHFRVRYLNYFIQCVEDFDS